MWIKNKYSGLMETKENLNWLIGVMLQNVEQAFKWLESGRLDPFGKNKYWLQADVEIFGGNGALDYFAKDIPKDNEFLK